MFKKKPPEGSGSPQAAAPGGKAGFLRRRWPLLVIAGAAIVGGVVWMTQVRATQAPAEAAYIETKPTRRSITNIYSEDGTVEAAESYQVKSLVRGDVLTADFEEGDMVQEGDVLYTIDSADAVNSVERAQLSLSQAQRDYEDVVDAQYVRTGIGGTVVSIAAAPGDVVTAGQEIATIRDESAMLLTLDFPAADAAPVCRRAGPAEVTLDGTYEKLAWKWRSPWMNWISCPSRKASRPPSWRMRWRTRPLRGPFLGTTTSGTTYPVTSASTHGAEPGMRTVSRVDSGPSSARGSVRGGCPDGGRTARP